MDLTFSVTEINQLAVIKLLFYLFIALGFLFYFKWPKLLVFVSLIALFLAGTYYALIWQSQISWWGLQGDEIFVTAFMEKVASGQFFADFFYSDLPPFYPPLYFWLVGGLGFLFQLNGVQSAQLGVFLVLISLPFLVYFFQKLYFHRFKAREFKNWQLLLAPALVFVVADWTAVILKPYEFFSAVLVVFWAIFLLAELDQKSLNTKKIIFYGISGGLLFLTFYFWFFVVAIAVSLFKLFSKAKASYYFSHLSLVGLIVLLLALPYVLPLLGSYISLGTENYQPAFFIVDDLNLYLPFLNFSVFGFVSLLGLLSIIFYFSRSEIKALGAILVSIYLWQLINLITVVFWQAPFLPNKPFIFLGGAVFSIAASFGLSQLISEKIKDKRILTGLFIFSWIILASSLLGGKFIDDPAVRNQLVEMKQPLREEFANLVDELRQVDGLNDLSILSGVAPEISAFLPLNYYVSYNAHFSHPAANFSDRYLFISDLASSKSAEDFYQKLKSPPRQKIDALLLLKGPGFYPIYFWLDSYGQGGLEREIRIPADLIDEQYFVKVFEDERFIFYQLN